MPGITAERVYEQVTASPLVERRRAGELFPRVPVGSLELTREQVAAGLYLSMAALPKAPARPTSEQMLSALWRAVDHLGVSGLDATAREMAALDLWDRTANTAYAYAYALCREHWYRGALSKLLPTGAVALALYASDIAVTRGGRSAFGREAEINSHLMEGVSRLGAATLARLSNEATAEFHPWTLTPFTDLDPQYQALTPDRRRRKFCYELAVSHQVNRRPLLVSLDAGGWAVGAIIPECPRSVAMHADLRGGAA
jgi:hypothetical protein